MKYLSLFTGVGGFELGIQQAYEDIRPIQQTISKRPKEQHLIKNKFPKWECVGFSEIDKYCNQVLRYHYPKIKNYGDITKINVQELPDFDLIVGGFPCQSFSIAGKRGGFKDTRGTLFFDIARIAEHKRPSYLLLENVKGLLNHDKGNTFATIISTLDELGYDCQWSVLNSKNFGVPQNRERVFIVGHSRGKPRRKVFPITGSNQKFNGKSMESKNSATVTSTYWKGNKGTQISTRQPLRFLERNQKNIEGDYAFTVDASQTSGIKQGMRIRRLTPTECERLQGFPDGWTKFGINEKGEKVEISDTQRYKMMGNAVTTNVVKEIMKKYARQSTNTKT